MKVGDCGEVRKEHVDKGVAVLFVSLPICAFAVVGRVTAHDLVRKY